MVVGPFHRPAALALAGSLVPTTLAGHRFWTETDPQVREQQKVHFMKNLGLLGGLLLTALDTGGRPSIPWRTRRATRHAADVVEDAAVSTRESVIDAAGALAATAGALGGAVAHTAGAARGAVAHGAGAARGAVAHGAGAARGAVAHGSGATRGAAAHGSGAARGAVAHGAGAVKGAASEVAGKVAEAAATAKERATATLSH
jgi:hypothetical protein